MKQTRGPINQLKVRIDRPFRWRRLVIREALQPTWEKEGILARRLRYRGIQREVQTRVQDHRMEDVVRAVAGVRCWPKALCADKAHMCESSGSTLHSISAITSSQPPANAVTLWKTGPNPVRGGDEYKPVQCQRSCMATSSNAKSTHHPSQSE